MNPQSTNQLRQVEAALHAIIEAALPENGPPKNQYEELGRLVDNLLDCRTDPELPAELLELSGRLMNACHRLDLYDLEPMATWVGVVAEKRLRDECPDAPADVVRAVAPRLILSDWAPAGRFWAALQIADPADIFGSPLRTDISVAHLKSVTQVLASAAPNDVVELGEKLKAVATLGVLRTIYKAELACSGECNTLSGWLIRVMSLNPLIFMEPYRMGDPSPNEVASILARTNPHEKEEGIEHLFLRQTIQLGLGHHSLRAHIADDWSRIMTRH